MSFFGAYTWVQVTSVNRRGSQSSMDDNSLELEVGYHLGEDSTLNLRADHDRLRQAAEWIATEFQLKRFCVSLSIVDDATIHELNRQHLDHDWPTDVISFAFECDRYTADGEVIASAETAARLASKAGWAVEDEILLYVIHGLLHVAGLDDLEAAARKEMREFEQRCLTAIGVAGASAHVRNFDRVTY